MKFGNVLTKKERIFMGKTGIIILILFLAWFFFTVACMWYAYTQRKSRGENPFTGKKRSR